MKIVYNGYVYESKTNRDSNDIKLYHVSPQGDIHRFTPKISKVFKEPVTFFSPSYKSLVEDWMPYVLGKRSKTADADKRYFSKIYLYTISVPREVYNQALKRYNDKYEEMNGEPFGFWSWGQQVALNAEELKAVKIISVKQLNQSNFNSEYQKQRNSSFNKYRLVDNNLNLQKLKNMPHNWLNEFNIKLLEKIDEYALKNKSTTYLKELKKELYNIRTKSNDNPNLGGSILEPQEIDKKKFNEIANKFNTYIKKVESNEIIS